MDNGIGIISNPTGHEYECCSRSGELELFLFVHHRGTCPDCGKNINRVSKHLVSDMEISAGEMTAIEWCHNNPTKVMRCAHGWINVITLTKDLRGSLPENPNGLEGQIRWIIT